MNISQFVFNQNNTKLEDLVSIKEFQSDEDLKNKINFEPGIITDGDGSSYSLFMTEEEFFKRCNHLNINKDNIYYNKNSFMHSNAVIYLDMSHFILLDLTNYLLFETEDKDSFSYSISDTIKELESHYNNKEYISLFLNTPDSFKLEMLERLISSKENIDDELYSAFMDFYVVTDFGFNSISAETINKLINSKSEKLKSKTTEKLSNLPDKIVVYRGQADKSTDYKQAYSWSIDPTVATFFSLRFIERNGKIVTGVIDKKDIIEYFDNSEQEVLILPDKIKNIKVYDFYSMESINKKTEDILDIFGYYKYILNNELDFKHDDRIHGKLHSLRVLLNALILGRLKNLSQLDLHLLAMASIYHDIGRTNNEIDDLHGLRSREIFEHSDFGENEIIKFLIEYHCIDDEVALKALKDSNIADKVKTKKLFSILKDVDALDRLRFGLRELDFTYLRNKESTRMILFAHFSVKSLKL